jgi:hypothetical protein
MVTRKKYVAVQGYKRKDGKKVRPHLRRKKGFWDYIIGADLGHNVAGKG